MITISPFDLALGAIALTGYGCLLGYLAGARYGRARAALRDKARHARIGAAFAFAMKQNAGVNESILGVLQAQQQRDLAKPASPTPVVVDWSLIEAAARAHGLALVPAAKQSELRH